MNIMEHSYSEMAQWKSLIQAKIDAKECEQIQMKEKLTQLEEEGRKLCENHHNLTQVVFFPSSIYVPPCI